MSTDFKDIDVLGVAVRDCSLVFDLHKLQDNGLITDYEGADVFRTEFRNRNGDKTSAYSNSGGMGPYLHKWYSKKSKEYRFSYEWVKYVLQDENDSHTGIFFNIITREEISTLEDYDKIRETYLSGIAYIL